MTTAYVSRDQLTRAEVQWNVDRLRARARKHRSAGRVRRADALDAHADALSAWDARRTVVPLRSAL